MSESRRKSGVAVVDRPARKQIRRKRRRSVVPLFAAIAFALCGWAIAREGGNLALAQSYRRLDAGDSAGAVSAAKTAVSMLPRDADALTQLGDSLDRGHDHAAAFNAYARALDISPGDSDAFHGLCRERLFSRKDLDTQVIELIKYLDANSGDAQAMLLLGETFERRPSSSDNEQRAITWEEKAEESDPGNEDIETTLGARFVSVNQPDNALRCYTAGLAKFPSSGPLLRGALLCYDELGQTANAAGIAARLQTAVEPLAQTPPFRDAPSLVPSTGPSTTSARFVDVAAAAGIIHSYAMVDSKPKNILQTIGAGCAFLDYNNDGNLDILLVDHTVKLFAGDGHGHFVDKTHEVGLDQIHGYFLGCAVGDFNNDGYDDIVLTGYNTVVLLKNDHGKRFIDVTAHSGIKTEGWNTCAAWGDIDNDGKLDLYVCRYADFPPGEMGLCMMEGLLSGCGPNTFKPERGLLYHNLGGGKFADVTHQWGVDGTSGKGLGVAFADFDGSGRQSLFIANDQLPSNLYLNTGSRFEDIGPASGTAEREDGKGFSGMGVDWGDYDNDGKPDLAVMDFQWEDKRILHNEGGRLFTQQYTKLGMRTGSYPWVSFGMKWLDYDNDGWLDMVYSTGHTDDGIQERESDLRFLEPTMIYHNEHGTRFTDASAGLIGSARRSIEGRGLAIGDYENNGLVDILVVDSNGSPLLLRNETANAGHWLDVNLIGVKSNRDGYGARVTALSGALRQTRVCHADGSYLSSSDKRVHLGIGTNTAIDSLTVQWPSGTVDKLTNVAADRVITVVEGRGLLK